MAKSIRRMLAMVLVMCMFVSALPMQALAAEEDAPFTTTDTMSGGDVSITVEPSGDVTVSGTNGSGESVSITGTTSDSGTTMNGTAGDATVSYTESVKTTTTTHPDGTVQSVTVTEGSETKEWEGEGVENVKGYEDEKGNKPVELPSVEVVVKPGEQTIVKDSMTITGTIGDIKEGANDTEYNYTDVTIEVDRTVSAEISKIEENVVIDPYKSNLDGSVKAEEYDGKEQPGTFDRYDYSDHYLSGLDHADEDYLTDRDKPTEDGYKQGYDLVWSGFGDSTSSIAAVVVQNAVWLKDENGNDLLDENGNKMLDWKKSTFTNGSNNKSNIVNEDGASQGVGMFLTPGQFVLEHENGNHFYAYCMDASTNAAPTQNRWYSIQNIESVIEPEGGDEDPNTYLTKEQAGMIRAIANVGYWGTDPNVTEQAVDKDGNLVFETNENGEEVPVMVPQQGSIASLKEMLKEVYKDNPDGTKATVTVNYPGFSEGKEYEILALIDGLTESEALAATQAAIWHFANYGDTTVKDTTNGTIVGLLSATKWHNDSAKDGGGWLMEYQSAYHTDASNFGKDENGNSEYDQDAFGKSDARLKALYQALLGLKPIYEDGANRTDSTVIPSKDVINDVTLTISDRVAGDAANEDSDANNDVYNASISFTLAFTPGENDEFFIELTNGDKEKPETILDANNNPIKKKLVSKDYKVAEGEEDKYLKPNEDGIYTLSGLVLSENVTNTLEIRLDGTQYLEDGVYIYQAFDGENGPARKASQTLVGMAKGTQHVTVTSKMDVKFDVNERNKVVTVQHWHSESDPVYTPPVTPPEYPVNPVDFEEAAPQVFRLANQNVEEIPEEPVPLAAPVITGDNSGLWIAVILLSVFAMAAINLFDKKRQQETF